jgi:hypothetical protein
MSNEVTCIEDKKPHVVMQCDCVRVIPLALLQDVVDGKMSLQDIDGWDSIVKAVIAEWLAIIKLRNGEKS